MLGCSSGFQVTNIYSLSNKYVSTDNYSNSSKYEETTSSTFERQTVVVVRVTDSRGSRSSGSDSDRR